VFTEDCGTDSMKIGELFMLETVASLDSSMVIAVLEFWAATKVTKDLWPVYKTRGNSLFGQLLLNRRLKSREFP
jgi:hypothetical protein